MEKQQSATRRDAAMTRGCLTLVPAELYTEIADVEGRATWRERGPGRKRCRFRLRLGLGLRAAGAAGACAT